MDTAVDAILGLAVVLFLVSLLLPWADRRSIPRTLVLAGLGIALGALAFLVEPAWRVGPLGSVFDAMEELGVSASLFLYVFLPPLLFTAGLTIDVRLLFDELGAVLLMAIVAVIVCTFVVGAALAAASPIGLVGCLLLGSVVATTDPAAVIDLFRGLGAPRRLTTLIAGESVLNDAAAIALATILLGMVTGGRDPDIFEGAIALVVNFVGGAILGFLMARLTTAILPRLRNTPVAEVTITVALAYFTFVVGERYAGVSGVVAVVAAALTFAVYGRTRLTAGSWNPLVQTWFQLEFWANSLIFVLAAMFAARILPDLRWYDLVLLLVLAGGALAARAMVLYGLLPLLSLARATEPVGNRYKTVILWGGLRGAVTLTLALSISQNPAIPADLRHFVLTLAAAYVLFTLLVQAPTLKPLLALLQLDRLDRTELALRDRAMVIARAELRDQLSDVAHDYGFDQDAVEEALPPAPQAEGADDMPLSADERLRVGLLTLAARERALYLRHHREGTMSRAMVARLVADADRLIDRVRARGLDGYNEFIGGGVRIPLMMRIALRIHRLTGWSGPLARRLAQRFERLVIAQFVVRELIRFNRRALRSLLGEDTANAIAEVLDARLGGIGTALKAVELQYPNYAAALRRAYLTRAALRIEEAQYQQQLDETLIGREIHNDLLRDLNRRRQAIDRVGEPDLGLEVARMVQRAPLFKELDEDSLRQVAGCLRPYLAIPGQHIVRRGVAGRAMYFIVSGQVEVRLDAGPVALSDGEFFGELALLTNKPRVADVVATSYCQLLVLDVRDFRRLARTIPAIEGKIKDAAARRMAANAAEPRSAAG